MRAPARPRAKHPRADPKHKYTVEHMAQALRETKGLITFACERAGCDYRTMRRMIDEFPELQELVTVANERRTDTAELKLDQAVLEGQPWAIQWALRGKRGYHDTVRQEITGRDGGPVTMAFPKIPDELLADDARREGMGLVIDRVLRGQTNKNDKE